MENNKPVKIRVIQSEKPTLNLVKINPTPNALDSKGGTMSVHTMTWLQTPTKISKNKGKKFKQPKMQYEIFCKAADYVTDPYWKELLMKAAYGKFPQKFKYIHPKLIFRYKDKLWDVEITDDAPVVANIFVQFILEHSTLRSELDIEKELKHRDEVLELHYRSWKDIKHKKIKKALLSQYIDTLKRQYNLAKTDMDSLKTLVNVGFLFNYFNNETVIYTNGKIMKIVGLVYDQDTKKFHIDSNNMKTLKMSKPGPSIPDDEYFSKHKTLNITKVPIMDVWYSFVNKCLFNNIPDVHKIIPTSKDLDVIDETSITYGLDTSRSVGFSSDSSIFNTSSTVL